MQNGKINFWFLATVTLAAIYLYLAFMANIDLSAGRFALFMDERVTFDGVHKIMHPDSFRSFLWNVFNGGDHRYGRSLWNSMALFSFIPTWILGNTGQIIAGRIVQVILLLSAFFILISIFSKKWEWRFLMMAVLLSLPFVDYYSTMPKPEPLQLLFVALFILYYKRNSMALGGMFWIFLGLAFGTKISILPVAVVFFGWTLLAEYQGAGKGSALDKLISSIGYFVVGLAIAVPILAVPVGVALIIYKIMVYLLKRYVPMQAGKFFWIKLLLVALIPAVVTARSIFIYMRGGKSAIASWGGAVMLSSKNAADLAGTNFITWLKYIFTEWLTGPLWLVAISLILITVFFFIQLLPFLRKHIPVQHKNALPMVTIAAGILLCASIIISVHRLWGFYLFTGMALILVGIISIAESALETKDSTRINKWLPIGTTSFLAVLVFGFWFPASYHNYKALAVRTQTEAYKNEYNSYLVVDAFLKEYAQKQQKKFSVSFDPELFPPSLDHKEYELVEFWGPITDWEIKKDVIIVGISHTPRGRPIPKASGQYTSFLKEREGYDKYVVDKTQPCVQPTCYERHTVLPDGGEIWVLKKSNSTSFGSE